MQDIGWKLGCLFEPLEGLKSFGELISGLEKPGVCSAYGPDDAQRAHLLAAVVRKTDRPMLVIAPNDLAAQRMAEDLNMLLEGSAKHLPARDITFLRAAASSRDLAMRRLDALGDCVCGKVKALVMGADAMMYRMMPPERFRNNIIEIEEGMQMEPADLIGRLTAAGYERVQLVEARGQCALRGGILDVYPVGGANALRVEFFDDEIDSVRSFDVMTQRSISRRSSCFIYPAQEILMTTEESEKAAEKLQALLEVQLEYPINAMTRICKKLSLPKKESLEAIAMYEMAYGNAPATAHDVFMAMQEIPYLMKTHHTPEAKMLVVEENMARALSVKWSDFDLAKAVSW